MRIASFCLLFLNKEYFISNCTKRRTRRHQRFMYFSDALGVLAELFSAAPAPYECTTPSRLQQFDVLESTESGTSLRA